MGERTEALASFLEVMELFWSRTRKKIQFSGSCFNDLATILLFLLLFLMLVESMRQY